MKSRGKFRPNLFILGELGLVQIWKTRQCASACFFRRLWRKPRLEISDFICISSQRPQHHICKHPGLFPAQRRVCSPSFQVRQGVIKCAVCLCCSWTHPEAVKWTKSKARWGPCYADGCPSSLCICGTSLLELSSEMMGEA